MTIRHAFFCFVIILFAFFLGCSQNLKDAGQEKESSPKELTLPQVPKLLSSYKPTNRHIQTALKNAGFYQGNIDGEVGPMTREAIRQFQNNNGLAVDGKVGPKTWALLSKYLEETEH